MRYGVILMACVFLLSGLNDVFAETEVVTISCSSSSRFRAKKDCEKQAKKAAVKQYLKRVCPSADAGRLERLAAQYPRFSLSLIQQDFSYRSGKAQGTYSVEIDDDQLMQAAAKMGLDSQGQLIKIVVLEEPPSKAKMQLGTTAAMYTDYQRRIRDAIIKKANEKGLKVHLLADMPEFEQYKSDDETLVGVYYDVDTVKFKINRGLLQKISETLPGVLAVYYRINGLYYDPKTRILKADISMSVKDLNTGETRSAGSKTYTARVTRDTPDERVHAFGIVAENATALLMNPTKNIIVDMISKGKNKPSQFVVKLSSLRTMYRLKKILEKDRRVRNARVQNGRLTFQVDPEVPPADFVFVNLYNAFDQVGLQVPEKNISIKGKEVVVRQ